MLLAPANSLESFIQRGHRVENLLIQGCWVETNEGKSGGSLFIFCVDLEEF